MEKKNFEDTYNIDVSEKVSERDGFDYLPWSIAWKEFILLFPNATYEIEKDEKGVPCFGSPEMGYMCYTSITADGVTRKMHLPVHKKTKAILKPDMFQVNTTIWRCLVKNMAMFGFGLKVYEGEYIPPKALESYDNDNTEEISKDPFDLEPSEADMIVDNSNKNKKESTEKKTGKRVIPKLETDFIKSVKDCKEYSAKKKKDILSNDDIGEVIKRAHVKGSYRFS